MEAQLKDIFDKQCAFFRTGQTRSIDFRRKQLQRLKSMFDDNQSLLLDALYKDLRRSPEMAMGVEIARVMGGLNYALEHLDEWTKGTELPTTPLGSPKIERQPVGTVLVIGAFNFPIDLALHPSISALAAGCTVVVKPSELAVHTSQLLYDLISKTFEPKYFACVQGDVAVSQALTNLPWNHLFYTGSPRVGKLVMAAAAKNLVPVTLELGGKNPCIVLPDADLEKVAESLVFGKFLNAGQLCLMTDYLILLGKDRKEELANAMKKHIEKNFTSNAQKSSSFGRIINQMHFDRLNGLLQKTKGEVLYKSLDSNDRSDLFVAPHVIQCTSDDCLMQEELFGPILAVLSLKDLDEAIDFVNKRSKPLAIYAFTNNSKDAQKLIDETSSGGVTVNGTVLHASLNELPFGGIGCSGIGRCNGKYGFSTFTHEKPILFVEQSSS